MTTNEINQIKREFGILGNSAELNHAIDVAAIVAPTDMSVLVIGESGVGKEVFSKIIHRNSDRRFEKYIAVNCGAIPEGTIESELFGHVKGSFTSADKDRKGYFAEADKGTIFLDEVGELPMNMQVKLLRVLESGEYIPVGSSKTMHCDVRIVAATNVNLLEAIKKGRFREDLYYRLNQIQINIPPLRERKDDIYILFKYFAVNQAEKLHIPHISLTASAREYLKRYPWNGNIRQLKNIAERLSILERDREIDVETLQRYIPMETSMALTYSEIDNFEWDGQNLKDVVIKNNKEIENLRKEVDQLKEALIMLMGSMRKSDVFLPSNTESEQTGEEIEDIENEYDKSPSTLDRLSKENILRVLDKHKTVKGAADELFVSERTLYRKITEYDIDYKKAKHNKKK